MVIACRARTLDRDHHLDFRTIQAFSRI